MDLAAAVGRPVREVTDLLKFAELPTSLDAPIDRHQTDAGSESVLDGVADDWPVDYQTLEPFFAENDRMMGVSGLAGDPAYPLHQPPMPPLPLGKSLVGLWRTLALLSLLCNLILLLTLLKG